MRKTHRLLAENYIYKKDRCCSPIPIFMLVGETTPMPTIISYLNAIEELQAASLLGWKKESVFRNFSTVISRVFGVDLAKVEDAENRIYQTCSSVKEYSYDTSETIRFEVEEILAFHLAKNDSEFKKYCSQRSITTRGENAETQDKAQKWLDKRYSVQPKKKVVCMMDGCEEEVFLRGMCKFHFFEENYKIK